MQQRVALARALAIAPRVLLLDEPLSALDALVRVQLREEIRRVQTQLGITTVYVTHDQEEALSISDRVAVVYAGGIEQLGPPAEIYGAPATRFVAEFIGTMNRLESRVADGRQGAVDINGSIVPVDAVRGRPVGQPVLLLLRPESITLEHANGSSPRAGRPHRRGDRTQLPRCGHARHDRGGERQRADRQRAQYERAVVLGEASA